MKEIGYNGPSEKESLYKLKKHFKIISRRAKSSLEIKKMIVFDNYKLNKFIDSFFMLRNQDFNKYDLDVFARQEKYRLKLLQDELIISHEIFNVKSKTVKQICETSGSPVIWAKFIYCLTKNLNSRYFLEMGTNLGISGSYILEALKLNNNNSYFVTMEGLPQLCTISSNHFLTINTENHFEVINGLYKNTFPKVLKKDIKFDTFFIDGNHQKAPTIKYFKSLKNSMSDSAVFIFDDINYSSEMQEAWQIIKNDKDVNYSIDLFKLGVIIIDKSDKNLNENFELHLAY